MYQNIFNRSTLIQYSRIQNLRITFKLRNQGIRFRPEHVLPNNIGSVQQDIESSNDTFTYGIMEFGVFIDGVGTCDAAALHSVSIVQC